jgi:high-affinity iron transporter
MLLTSVVLILQETLEASLLVAILAVAALQTGHRLTWLPWGFLAGCALGFVYATNLQRVSEWFDYVGQELTNAALQLAIAVAAVLLAWLVVRSHARQANEGATDGAAERDAGGAVNGGETQLAGPPGVLFSLLCALAILLAITREGSEIMVYLGGFLGQDEKVQAVLVGSAIGFGIGVSVGLLAFYGLLALGGRWVPVALLALFSGNMLAQSALQLTQADWLQAGRTLWDSSAWLPEQSIAGHLLYALLGYESTPSMAQAVAYLAGVAVVLVAALAAALVTPRTDRRTS